MSQINKIGVIGAGSMGSGIAQKLAQEGINVVLVDIEKEFVERGISIIDKTLQEAVQRNVISQEQKNNALGRITGTTYLQAAGDCDIVIETIIEDRQAKSELFETLEELCSIDTIIATNTSNLSVNDFAKKLTRPERFIGMHYFYHPAKNKLLELIPAGETSRSTIDTCVNAALLHGKTPIIVKDSPGFSVNRYFVPSLNESSRILEEDIANIATIEEAYKRAFGVGMGAFELMNVTGVFLAAHGNSTLAEALGPFYRTCDILKNQARKNENWKVEGIVDTSKIKKVIDRLYGFCLGIAATMVDEGVASMEDIDTGAEVGLRWAKGPFELMNAIGIDKTYELVEEIANRYPDFQMPKMLNKLRDQGKAIDFSLNNLNGAFAQLNL